MKSMSDKVPLTAERKAEIYAKIEAGEYGTKETTEPGCKKILDLGTSSPVGFICVKCGRIFSECSGGYRYQHIRMCNGTKETAIGIRRKKTLKPTSSRPVAVVPTTSPRDPHQSTSSNSIPISISNGVHDEKNLYANTWITALSTKKEKEKFVADLSKLLLDHLPFKQAVESINAFDKCLQSRYSFITSKPPQDPELDSAQASNSPTPVPHLKSEVMGDYFEDFSNDQNVNTSILPR